MKILWFYDRWDPCKNANHSLVRSYASDKDDYRNAGDEVAYELQKGKRKGYRSFSKSLAEIEITEIPLVGIVAMSSDLAAFDFLGIRIKLACLQQEGNLFEFRERFHMYN